MTTVNRRLNRKFLSVELNAKLVHLKFIINIFFLIFCIFNKIFFETFLKQILLVRFAVHFHSFNFFHSSPRCKVTYANALEQCVRQCRVDASNVL